MPTRNAIKTYASQSYYHLYSRGVNKQPIFLGEEDYTVFISLFKRYLSPSVQRSPQRVAYPNYHQNVKLIAFALMPNHFHLYVYQESPRGIEQLMRSLVTSYSMYFNRKHRRVGPVFQSRYLALRIDNNSQFLHISRYIHLNPSDWRKSKHTSLDYFLSTRSAEWIHPDQVLDMSPSKYLAFLNDYTDRKALLDEAKWSLANQDQN